MTCVEAEVWTDVGTGSGHRIGGCVGKMRTAGIGDSMCCAGVVLRCGAAAVLVGSWYEEPGSLLLLLLTIGGMTISL